MPLTIDFPTIAVTPLVELLSTIKVQERTPHTTVMVSMLYRSLIPVFDEPYLGMTRKKTAETH